MPRRVLLYELNEVPWPVVDRYVAIRPRSNLAKLLPQAMLRTTIDDDPVELMPWRSWPTFHTSLYTADHNSYDQGQDPASFRGTPLWDVADANGQPVGLFGALQTWPPRPFRAGGFYVPDSFAPTPETVPGSLRRFQEFNTAMTGENSFAAERSLSPRELAGTAAHLLRRGLTPWSLARAAEQVVLERRDARYKSRRPIAQVLLCFDMFWRLDRRHEPRLSIFFTNHVASMMHRFWGDWMPEYALREPYEPDDVYRHFVPAAMDLFDHGLGQTLRWADRTPGAVVIVASSMGQGPIPYHSMSNTYVLEQSERLVAALGLEGARLGPAMYPRVTFLFDRDEDAGAAVTPVRSAATPVGPLFRDLRKMGASLSFEIGYAHDAADLPREVVWTPLQGSERRGDLADLGVSVRGRPGGGNTAQHVPEGIFIAYGDDIAADGSRSEVGILDAAPSILDLLGLDPAESMQGRPSIFRPTIGAHI